MHTMEQKRVINSGGQHRQQHGTVVDFDQGAGLRHGGGRRRNGLFGGGGEMDV